MALYPHATFHPVTNINKGLARVPPRGLVVHITSNLNTVQGLVAWFSNRHPPGGVPPASAHFGISQMGKIWQFVDTSDRAWAIDGGENDSWWISVENVALSGQQLTLSQMFGVAFLLKWLSDSWGMPLQLAAKKTDFGLGYHSMFKIGDHACPGKKVEAQLKDIVRFANEM